MISESGFLPGQPRVRPGRLRLAVSMTAQDMAWPGGEFPLGGDLTINRLGFGAMRLARGGFQGPGGRDGADPRPPLGASYRAVANGAGMGVFSRLHLRVWRENNTAEDGIALATRRFGYPIVPVAPHP